MNGEVSLKSNQTDRLVLLRKRMHEMGLSAFIVTNGDPHLSEYVPEYWKQREWLSGFTGSVGTMVVLKDKAALWTDSRYYLQAEIQLFGTGIDIVKISEIGAISIPNYIKQELESTSVVGLNGRLFSTTDILEWDTCLKRGGIVLNVEFDLIKDIWLDRPRLVQSTPYIYSTNFAGVSFKDKMQAVNAEMAKRNAVVFPVTSLDEVAWLLNIRGNDVHYNPFSLAYGLIENEKVSVFVAKENISKEIKAYFKEQEIVIRAYDEFELYLSRIKGQDVLLDRTKLNYRVFEMLDKQNNIVGGMSPIVSLKAIKNDTEINGIKTAMLKDAVALVKWNTWLEDGLKKGHELTELSVADKLHECRTMQDDFKGESFSTIAAYAANGAIVHYAATKETNATIHSNGFLLVDSGGHYLQGTTDITRTIALGELLAQEKKDFTLVLKGHIALAKAKFPKGTRGGQLDTLARQYLWQHGANYGHGTGHGVGCFLGVHEGPASIRSDLNPTALQQGMVLSNEPGVYRENEYGIRIENLMLVVKDISTEFGDFLAFETLTLFPIDVAAIDFSLMNNEEVNWLNIYHANVYDLVSPFLNEEECKWLKEKCKQIKVRFL